MPQKKQKPIDRLLMALGTYVLRVGGAQWTNGYRTARFAADVKLDDSIEGQRLYAKERAEWDAADEAAAQFKRLALKLLRESQSFRSFPKKKNAGGGRKGGRR